MRTIILGLGNPIMGDDGIGCRIIEEIERKLADNVRENIAIEPFYRGGIALMERLVGFDQALIVDAIMGLGGEIGSIHRLTLDDLPTMTADSPHDTSLKTAIEMGSRLGTPLPSDIIIFAIEIKYSLEFSEELSPPVEASIQEVTQMVLAELAELA